MRRDAQLNHFETSRVVRSIIQTARVFHSLSKQVLVALYRVHYGRNSRTCSVVVSDQSKRCVLARNLHAFTLIVHLR